MGITHIRTPKNFVLEERLERYGRAIEQMPERLRGRWTEACHPLATAPGAPGGLEHGGRYERVHLDLGCGKGSFM